MAAAASLSVKEAVTAASDFPLVVNGRAAAIVVDSDDAEVVRVAAGLPATDIETVTGVKPAVIRDTPTRLSPAEIREHSPMLEYRANAAKAGDVQAVIDALPTHRLTPAHEMVTAVSVNDEAPVVVRCDQGADDENDATWQRNVLRNAMYGRATLRVPQGAYTLKLWAADCGVVVQQISVNPL